MFDASTKTIGGRVDFAVINQVAIGNLDHLVADLLPGGRVTGREYCCSDLAGGHGNSLRVNLDSGKWADFATDQKGGDPISLVAAIKNCSQSEAARDLAATLGVTTGRLTPSPPKATWRTVPATAPPAEIRHQKFGNPTNTWEYRGPAGELLGIVCRFDRPTPPGQKQRKEILPLTFGTDDPKRTPGWRWKSWPEPRPLHGLDRLAVASPDAPVMISEGEKAAAAAQRLLPEFVAMTWPGGSNAAAKTDFRPIAGRPVTIWPDADEPGLKAAAAVAEQLRRLSCEVRILPVPTGAADGWDAADAEAEGIRPEMLREVIRAAWAVDDQALSPDVNKKRFMLTHISEIVTKPPDWLVHNFMTRDSLGLIFSDPGGCKTFLAVAAACCVATGEPFYGQQVRQSPVVFIAGEGFGGLKRRFDAWSIRHQVKLIDAPLFVSNMAAALLDPSSVAEIEAAIDEVVARRGPPGAIIIDTLARNFGPGDENSTADMGTFIQAADQIRVKYRSAVLLVHHSGHGDKTRARGAMALKGALDFEYRLTRDEDEVIRMDCSKCKDFEQPAPMAFRLRSVELPMQDEEGRPVTSAVLDPTDYEPLPRTITKAGRGKNQTKALEVLRNLFEHHRAALENDGRDPAGARVTVDEWQQESKNKVGIERNRFKEVKRSLEEQGAVTIENNYVRFIQE